MSHMLEDLKQFLDSSPTPWHTVQQIGNRLASIDFTPIEESDPWELEPSKKYFVQKGGSLCAFNRPLKKPRKIVIIASHSDSPSLKLKPQPEIYSDGITLLGTELYGAPILSSWFNRDLAIAGQVITETSSGEIQESLVLLDEVPLIIPQLALHFERDMKDKNVAIDAQNHIRPIACLGMEKTDYLHHLLKRHTATQKILAFDLFLIPLDPARFLGLEGEMLASYRLDNLSSVHACTAAIASANKDDVLQIALVCNHEEIGSCSMEGAASPFLTDVLSRIANALSLNMEELIRLKSQSLCISVDVAHGYHPSFPQKYDPQHLLSLGKGIAIKYNADQKYASSAKTAAHIIAACGQIGIKHQSYVCRSDIPCGSTIGPVIAKTTGIPTVDIGIPLLSMHSAREVIACQDHLDLCQLLTYLLESVL